MPTAAHPALPFAFAPPLRNAANPYKSLNITRSALVLSKCVVFLVPTLQSGRIGASYAPTLKTAEIEHAPG
jgi:hypothetical protein